MRHPVFSFFLVTAHNTARHAEPINKHTPDQSCGPKKLVVPSGSVLSKAPAIGEPINVAILETLHDMPRRVPRRDMSGQIFAKAAEGSVTSAADKKPFRISIHRKIYWVGGTLTPKYAERNE